MAEASEWELPVPVGLALVAVIGWIAAIVPATQRSDLERLVSRYAQLRCVLTPEPQGFRLEGQACGPLSDVAFRRQE